MLADSYHVLAHHDGAGFGNATPAQAEVFAVDFAGQVKTCFGVAMSRLRTYSARRATALWFVYLWVLPFSLWYE
ncbi:hypothetical protein [Hymenobacter elongatus]|uniref:hypothetical protein n=1 Tax=Hymenobacter elongatus TaxID=877208 RepID=UPI001436775D|nr:hypothetical protein [Hymenobacter elongatus]